MSLELLTRAEKLLAQVATVDDAVQVIDFAEAARVYAREAKLGTSAMNHATVVKLRAERRLADIVDAGQQAGVIADRGRPKGPESGPLSAPTLKELGVEKQRLAEARKIRDTYTDADLLAAAADANEHDRALSRDKLIQQAKHRQREADKRERAIAEAATLPAPALLALADWRDWLPDQPTCDLLLTDPPYATDVADIEAFARDWLPVALDKVLSTGRAYVCVGAYPDELGAYLAVKPPAHLTLAQVLVWTYRNTLGPSPTFDYKGNWQAVLYYRGLDAPPLDCPEMVEQFAVQDLNAPDGRRGDRWHAWQKPDALAERFVRHATRPGQRVLDPFAGTGTHLLAAARLGRVAAGCEVDPATFAIALERGCRHDDAC